jgi:hypothetical protein
MSAVCILAPAVIAGWPAISAAVAGAATALGMNMIQEAREVVQESEKVQARTVEVALENSEVLQQQMRTGEEILMTRGKMRIRVFRDERGQCRVCVSGEGSKRELEALGREVAGRITQIFIYNKVMTELRGRKFEVTREEVAADQTVRLHVRGRLDA